MNAKNDSINQQVTKNEDKKTSETFNSNINLNIYKNFDSLDASRYIISKFIKRTFNLNYSKQIDARRNDFIINEISKVLKNLTSFLNINREKLNSKNKLKTSKIPISNEPVILI